MTVGELILIAVGTATFISGGWLLLLEAMVTVGRSDQDWTIEGVIGGALMAGIGVALVTAGAT